MRKVEVILIAFYVTFFIGCTKETSVELNFHPDANIPIEDTTDEGKPNIRVHLIQVNRAIAGYVSATPQSYQKKGELHPLIISLHGSGQYGDGTYTGIAKIFAGGIPKALRDSSFSLAYHLNGEKFSFIILAPQFVAYPKVEVVQSFIEYAKQNYRIDSTRIYVTGLSAGGMLTCDFAAKFALTIAAIAPMAGESHSDNNLKAKCKAIADANLPIWVFHNIGDKSIPTERALNFVSVLKSFSPRVAPKLTLFQGPGTSTNHDAWTLATDPKYKEDGKNIFEWMLLHKR